MTKRAENMLRATISADIVASSSLSAGEMHFLTERIGEIFRQRDTYRKVTGGGEVVWRLVLGDTIECYVPNPNDALRIALILKSGVKSSKANRYYTDESVKYDREREKLRKVFETYGVRVAIGIGGMDSDLLERGIFKGDAINLSGRLIAEQKTSNKDRVTVKNTLFIGSVNERQSAIFKPIMSLLDTLFNKITPRQSEITYMKLLGFSEGEIAQYLHITQSSVNQHSTAVGWNSIEEALKLYETFDFNATFAS